MAQRLVITTTQPVDLVWFVSPQLQALQDRFDVHLISSAGDWHSSPLRAHAQWHRLDMSRSISPLSDVVAIIRWVRLLKSLRPAILLSSTPKAGLLSMLAGKLTRIPRRVFLHRGAFWESSAGFKGRLLREADRMTMRFATDVLAVSHSLATLIVAEGLSDERPVVLANGGSKGVNLTRFSPGDAPQGPLTLGFLGRLAQDKGIDTALEAFREVHRSFPDSRLLIAGYLDDASPASRQTLVEIHANPNVQWLGSITDTPKFLRALDVLVFPSQREGLPNAVIEAAACGVPTVAWDVTGVRDAVDPGVTGILVAKNRTDQLTEAIFSVLARPRGSYRADCVAWAQRFDEDRVTAALINYLESGVVTPGT